MTTPTFVINGSITFHGVSASWQRVPRRVNDDGTATFQPYLLHFWDIPQMTADTFLSLQAQAGKRLTSISTTNVNDRNNGATYTDAEITSMTNGQHVGMRMTNVRVEFRIKP